MPIVSGYTIPCLIWVSWYALVMMLSRRSHISDLMTLLFRFVFFSSYQSMVSISMEFLALLFWLATRTSVLVRWEHPSSLLKRTTQVRLSWPQKPLHVHPQGSGRQLKLLLLSSENFQNLMIVP